jgi:hypothetical protein
MATTTYEFADGHDNAAGLSEPPLQPRTEQLPTWNQFAAGSGISQRIGGGRLVFSYNALTYGEYDSLTTFFGVSNAGTVSKLCTISVREGDGTTYNNYNATLTFQQPPQRGVGHWRNLEFTFTKLEAI